MSYHVAIIGSAENKAILRTIDALTPYHQNYFDPMTNLQINVERIIEAANNEMNHWLLFAINDEVEK